jgi:hypothetical protein
MTRCRLILAACVAAVALGAAWWLYGDGLSAEERWLVGTWHLSGPTAQKGSFLLGQDRDGSLIVDPLGVDSWAFGEQVFGRWSFRDSVIFLDLEQNPAHRVLRPVCALLHIKVGAKYEFAISSVSPDEFAFSNRSGTREVWTRDRGD